MTHGFDYASVDGNHIDYTKIPGQFLIVRAAYGYNGQAFKDRSFPDAQMRFPLVGAYLFLNLRDAVEPQVAMFRAQVGAEMPSFGVWLDLEADSAGAMHMAPKELLAKAEMAHAMIEAQYGVCGIYTSQRVIAEVFEGLVSDLWSQPLWLKVPYFYKARRPWHPESAPTSPHGWITQYQGDAVGVAGFSSTVDANVFTPRASAYELEYKLQGYTITEFQSAHGLQADGIIGPKTFSALLRA